MPTSLVEVFNLALSSCGSDAVIQAPDEQSREAALCSLWYPTVRKHIISTAPWPSVLSHASLTRTKTRTADTWSSTDPAPGYGFAYHTPQDMLLPYHLHSFRPFTLRGEEISTDDEQPVLFYLRDLDEPASWDEPLASAITHYLAARISRPLTGNREVVVENFEIARFHVDSAKAQAAELLPQTPMDSLPDWITARGYTTSGYTRFFWPMTHLNPVTA